MQLMPRTPEVFAAVAPIAGTVHSVSRGFRADTITVQFDTPHGIASLALPQSCARDYVVGQPVTLSVSVQQ